MAKKYLSRGNKLMNVLNRRELIATVGVVAVAGCTGNNPGGSSGDGGGSDSVGGQNEEPDSDGDGVPDSEDDFPNDSSYSELLNRGSDSFDLNEDYYQSLRFNPSQTATLAYQVDVQGDVPIDVILTDETNFAYYEDGTEFEYYAEGSDMSTLSANVEVQLSAGTEYYLVFDNTNRGRAEPPTNFDNDRVSVSVEYVLAD